MNARLYDASLGRFLSPDPYVQMPDFSQNFNRYSYCLNNPLVYYDKDGEIIGTIFTAIINTFENIFKHGVNFGHYDYSKTQRAWEIDKGLFTGNFFQVLNKWTWGLPNTIIGNATGHTLNVWGAVDRVTHSNGAVALSGVTPGNSAFTIGNYIFGPDNFTADWRDHLFVHEYGHYIQSQQFGIFYLPIIGATSLASASGLGGNEHKTRWFEVNASKQGAEYFDYKHGSGKKGYIANSPDYFDMKSFTTGVNSRYINPRTGNTYQGSGHPIAGARFSIWDVLVPMAIFTASYGGFMFIF
jgi:hypothetical protein